MSKPELSIVCTAFNRPDRLIETLHLLRKGTDVDYEFFICDNSDTPVTLDLLPNEHYLWLDGNRGTAGRVEGIRAAQAPYILLLDDDSAPEPASMRRILDYFSTLPASIAGLMPEIHLAGGGQEASLLPTVSIGCGVLFRADAIQAVDGGYPSKFGFYGEEYWQTLVLYEHGYELKHCPDLIVHHRADKSTGNKEWIFYHLCRNNGVIWDVFTPPEYREQILYDTYRRYELIAQKEGVLDAYRDGRNEALTVEDEPRESRLTTKQFNHFALLNRFDRRDVTEKKIALCGTGKFPSFWADYLTTRGAEEILIFDFNTGLIGNAFGDYIIYSPEELTSAISNGFTPLVGHSTPIDTRKWVAVFKTMAVHYLMFEE